MRFTFTYLLAPVWLCNGRYTFPQDPLYWRSVDAAYTLVKQHFQDDCLMRLSTLKTELRITSPALRLDTSDSSDAAASIGNATMLLCQHVLPPNSDSPERTLPTDGAFAMFMYANRHDYLLKTTTAVSSTMSKLSATTSKFLYSERTDTPLFLALGRLDHLQNDRSKSPACLKGGVRTPYNSLKAIGLLGLFLLRPGLRGAFYTDTDAQIIDFTATPADYFALSSTHQADLIGTSNLHDPILINGGALLFRNSLRGRRMLAAWWAYRCGRKDQPGLWRAILEQWPGFAAPFSDEVNWQTFSPLNYLTNTYKEVRNHVATGSANAHRWDCDGACGWLFRRTGCLLEPLETPGTLLLPVKPFSKPDSQGQMPALQHYAGLTVHDEAGQWVCHADNAGGKACLPKSVHEASEEEKHEHERRLHLKRREELCIVCSAFARKLQSSVGNSCESSNNASFAGCSCREALAPKYLWLKSEGKVIARCSTCDVEANQSFEFSMH